MTAAIYVHHGFDWFNHCPDWPDYACRGHLRRDVLADALRRAMPITGTDDRWPLLADDLIAALRDPAWNQPTRRPAELLEVSLVDPECTDFPGSCEGHRVP